MLARLAVSGPVLRNKPHNRDTSVFEYVSLIRGVFENADEFRGFSFLRCTFFLIFVPNIFPILVRSFSEHFSYHFPIIFQMFFIFFWLLLAIVSGPNLSMIWEPRNGDHRH